MPRRRPRDDDYDDDDDRDDLEPHRGSTILVLGLLALLVCGLIGPFAWSMGSTDLKKMAAGEMDDSGRGETQAGYICGIIATLLMGVALVFVILWIVFFAAVMGGAGAGNAK